MSDIISVVVPVYNNQPTLEKTFRQIMEVHESGFKDSELEVIFVNDGSTDGSWEELLRLKRLYREKIFPINLSRNFGQAGAMLAGFNSASGDAVIAVSADLQDPIGLMAKMVALWKSGIEIVICHRQDRTDGFFTRAFSNFAHSIARIAHPDLPMGGFDYWLMSKRVCKLLCVVSGRKVFLQGHLLSISAGRNFIPYTRVQRAAGQSGYTFWGKLGFVIDHLIDSYVPIRFMSYFGAFVTLCGVICALLIVYQRLIDGTPVSGWAAVMAVVLIIGGILMIMLGMIGEYVWRIYDRGSPSFVIQTRSVPERDTSDSVDRPQRPD